MFICIFKFYSNCFNLFPKTTAQILRTLNIKMLIIFVKNSTDLLESEALPSKPCSLLTKPMFSFSTRPKTHSYHMNIS